MTDKAVKPAPTGAPTARLEWSVSLEAPVSDDSEPVSVGWLLADDYGSVIYDPPARVHANRRKRTHQKSAASCPAVLNLDTRLFEINCPFDLALEFTRTEFGEPAVCKAPGFRSPVGDHVLDQLIVVSAECEWRDPEKPVIQLRLPYIFLADEPVYMAQMPPFYHRPANPLPGVMIGGRFPINVWPRTLSWALEWHETDQPLVLKRGEPMFYLQFETTSPARTVQMVEAIRTPHLQTYMDSIAGVVNYVDKTFSLFEAAEAKRPARLLEPVRK